MIAKHLIEWCEDVRDQPKVAGEGLEPRVFGCFLGNTSIEDEGERLRKPNLVLVVQAQHGEEEGNHIAFSVPLRNHSDWGEGSAEDGVRRWNGDTTRTTVGGPIANLRDDAGAVYGEFYVWDGLLVLLAEPRGLYPAEKAGVGEVVQ